VVTMVDADKDAEEVAEPEEDEEPADAPLEEQLEDLQLPQETLAPQPVTPAPLEILVTPQLPMRTSST